MESAIQSSFIPHDATTPAKAPLRPGRSGLGDLLLVLGIVTLAASAALAVAVFLYQQYLNSSSASDVAQLQRAESEFQPQLIDQLTRLNDRMAAAQTILQSHLAPSAFFNALNQVTLQTVAFSGLDLEVQSPQLITLKVQGVAQSVNSIALESQLLTQSGVFTSPIFSDIDRQQDGVHFDLSANVNPQALNFGSLVSAAASGSGAPGAATQPAQTQQQALPPQAASSSAPGSAAGSGAASQ